MITLNTPILPHYPNHPQSECPKSPRYMPQRCTLAIHLSTLLRKCGPHAATRPGRQAHAQSLLHGLQSDRTLQTDLVLLYSRCSLPHLSRQVFDQIPRPVPLFSWNLLFSSYVHSQLHHEALSLLPPFLRSDRLPDRFTLPPLFKACTATKNIANGLLLHTWAAKLGLDNHVVVRTSLLDMYVKSGHVPEAYELFFGLHDPVACNSMIAGLSRAGLVDETLDMFRTLQWEVGGSDGMAYPSVLGACGRGGDLRSGMQVHGRLVRGDVLGYDVAVGNALVDMYAKCGRVDDSFKVFSRMGGRNVVTWSAMISCYGANGRGKEALGLYNEMVEQGLRPNCVTFTSVLSGCSHSGLVDEGHAVFDSMTSVYRLEPSIEHYACMVDLLGRAGSIREALRLIKGMPVEPAASVWGALLGACAVHGNVEVAEIAAASLFELEPENASNYVALCGVYEMIGMWGAVANLRARMREKDMVKTPGCSWIDMKGRVHAFYQGNAYFPDCSRVCEALDGLWKIMAWGSLREETMLGFECPES